MKQFLKFSLASCFGIFLFLVFLALLGGSIGLSSFFGSLFKDKIKEPSILVLDSKNTLPEKSNNVDQGFSFSQDEIIGLHALVDVLEDAATNDKIKGIYLKTTSLPTSSYSNARILREAINKFKESGKWVYSFADGYSQGGYYLSSAADSVFLNPVGSIDFRGLGTEILFYKDMLDKLGVKPEVFYAGKFKSATEPIRRMDISEPNRLQIKTFINDIYKVIIDDLAESRGMTADRLHIAADSMWGAKAESALESGLVDGLKFKDEFLDLLKSKMEVDKYEDIKFIDASSYRSKMDKKKNKAKDKIAVVIAEGTILDYNDENGVIDGDRYAKIIRKLREDEKTKAIVMRVSSPGGSVLASNKIWRELIKAKEQGIPVIASMGDYAASGGYYISCMADTIFAQANTITGSIGVFGVNYNFNELATQKLGMNIDTVKTDKFSALGGNILPTDEDFKGIIQGYIDDIYVDFKTKVAEGRGMSVEAVEEIAQGRVWTGQKALDINLVDRIGDLDDAISSAKSMAELDEYAVSYYPVIKDPMQKIIDDLTGKKSALAEIENGIIEVFPDYRQIIELREMNGKAQMSLPYKLEFE